MITSVQFTTRTQVEGCKCAVCFQSDLIIPTNSFWKKWEKYTPWFQSNLTVHCKCIWVEHVGDATLSTQFSWLLIFPDCDCGFYGRSIWRISPKVRLQFPFWPSYGFSKLYYWKRCIWEKRCFKWKCVLSLWQFP